MNPLLIRRRGMMVGEVTPPAPVDYLCFTALQNNCEIGVVTGSGRFAMPATQYQINDGAWLSLTKDVMVQLNENDYIKFRHQPGEVIQRFSSVNSNNGEYNKFAMTGFFAGSGNVMTLLDATGTTTEIGSRGFRHLFDGCANMTTAPYCTATVIGINGIMDMYNGCTGATSHHFYTINNSPRIFLINNSCLSFRIDDPTPPTLYNTSISGLKSDCAIYVPAGSVEAYKSATLWSVRAAYIQAIPNT